VRSLIRSHIIADQSTSQAGLKAAAISRIPISNAFADARGITFIYNPGELSPRQDGGYHALLPWREVEPLLATRYRGLASTAWTPIQPHPQSYNPN
jgi:hypothetical protein